MVKHTHTYEFRFVCIQNTLTTHIYVSGWIYDEQYLCGSLRLNLKWLKNQHIPLFLFDWTRYYNIIQTILYACVINYTS